MVVTSSVLAAAMEMLHIKSLQETPPDSVIPNGSSLWTKEKECRKALLDRVSEKIVNEFISFSYHSECEKSKDKVFLYNTQLMSIGLFFVEYSDAIKEGDGSRVLRCWRYLVPIYKSSGRKNYSIEAFNLLCQHHHGLPPKQAAQLIWSRFINVHGLPGRNIPGDLHQEHLNRVIKDAIGRLGSNKTDKAITLAGKVLGTLSPLMDQFDKENGISRHHSHHKPANFDKDRDIIIHQLRQSYVFTNTQACRKHKTFPRPRNVLFAMDHDTLQKWVEKHL